MKFIKYSLYILTIITTIVHKDKIINNMAYLLNSNKKIVLETPNNYYKNIDYEYLKQSKDFIPYSKQDLINIYYSILDRGYSTFTFYCPKEYTSCINDLEEIILPTNDTLSNLNYFISPFNSEKKIKTVYSSTGEITVYISDKLYSEEEINAVNNKIDEIIKDNITNDMALEDKILKIHDYIINNTKYDTAALNNTSKYKSYNSYGTLIEGYSTCNGYADTMALFLDRFGVKNYRVASSTHVWNAALINNKWYHLDLTWDDPITTGTNIDTLTHQFYLIDTEKLENYQIKEHNYNKFIYRELS